MVMDLQSTRLEYWWQEGLTHFPPSFAFTHFPFVPLIFPLFLTLSSFPSPSSLQLPQSSWSKPTMIVPNWPPPINMVDSGQCSMDNKRDNAPNTWPWKAHCVTAPAFKALGVKTSHRAREVFPLPGTYSSNSVSSWVLEVATHPDTNTVCRLRHCDPIPLIFLTLWRHWECGRIEVFFFIVLLISMTGYQYLVGRNSPTHYLTQKVSCTPFRKKTLQIAPQKVY